MCGKADHLHIDISIHAPSRERQSCPSWRQELRPISIHAPSRERPHTLNMATLVRSFQSTLPRGSDVSGKGKNQNQLLHFNPRSLAGATFLLACDADVLAWISIHAPSRERHHWGAADDAVIVFQSTLPRGSDQAGRFPYLLL